MSASVKRCLIIFCCIVVLDQLTKCEVIKYVGLGERVRVLSFFNLVLVQNTGVSFGMFREMPEIFPILLSFTVVCFLVIYAKNNGNSRMPISMIIGGAVGNLVDRIVRGSVIDFLDFHACGYHWPAFNVADSAIVIGAFLLFFADIDKENHLLAEKTED